MYACIICTFIVRLNLQMILVYYHGLVSKLRTLFYSISLFALKKDKLINNKKYTAYAICCRRPSVWFFPGILKNGKREAGDIFFGIPRSRQSRFKYKSIINFIILRRPINPILRKNSEILHFILFWPQKQPIFDRK